MTTQHAISLDHEVHTVINTLSIEKEYFFSTQSKIQKATGCSFKDAQLASRSILEKLSLHFAASLDLERPIMDIELGNLINIEVSQLKRLMSKNFQLSEHEFIQLSNLLRRGDNSLFEKVFLIHFNDCVNFIEKKFYVSHDEAYDASMDALILFRQKIIDGKIRYGNIRFLFTQMASQLFIKSKVKATKEAEAITPEEEMIEEVDDFSLKVLESSWQSLGQGCKDLLTKIYYGNMKLTEIAAEEDKSDFTIRKQKQRCVDRIRSLFQKNITQSS